MLAPQSISTSSPARPRSPDRGSTTKPTCAPRSNDYGVWQRPTTRPIPDRQRATDASLHQRLQVATDRIRQLEADNHHVYGMPSRRRSGNGERTPAATRRDNKIPPHSNHADSYVVNTVRHTNPQVTGPPPAPAQDNDGINVRDRAAPHQGHQGERGQTVGGYAAWSCRSVWVRPGYQRR